jgi:hypothetical protein
MVGVGEKIARIAYLSQLLPACVRFAYRQSVLFNSGERRTAKSVFYFKATTKLVTIMLANASGRRNFQPNAINWS